MRENNRRQAVVTGRQCTVCRSAARPQIDGELLVGNSVAAVHSEFGNDAGLSLSAVYRHARGYHHAPKRVAPPLADESSGDVVSGLVASLRAAKGVLADAQRRGAQAVALRAAAEVRQSSTALAERVGVSAESVANDLTAHRELQRLVVVVGGENPELFELLARAADARGWTQWATELRDAHKTLNNKAPTMSKTTTETVWATVVRTGLTIREPSNHVDRFATRPGRVLTRGDEIEISGALADATRDRYGFSPFDDGVPTEDVQVRLWGDVFFRPGRLAEHSELQALLEDERAREAEADRLARVREAARYGRRYVAAHDADVVAYREGAR